MSDLARFDDVHYSERALELGALSFDRWAELGTLLGRIHGSVGWWVGDWLLHGERCFGEAYAQAADATGLHPDTLRAYAWVAERVPPVRRRTSLSWSAHREVAALEQAEADALLDRADAEGLGSRDVRRIVRERRALEAGEEPMEGLVVRAPVSAVERWKAKAGARPLPEIVVELMDEWADAA